MRIIALAPLILAACGPYTHAATAAPTSSTGFAVPVRTARASEAGFTAGDELTGTVRAARSATLAAMVMGTVAEVHAALGSRLRAGEVVVRLSARELDARLVQAEAAYAQAKLERDRSVALRADDAISQAQADASVSQFRVAEAAQAEARAMDEHTVIRAPFAGVVTAKLVEAGDLAVPGRPLLVVEAPERLRFEATVPEGAAQALRRGDTLAVSIDGAGAAVSGTIAEISPAADLASRTVLIKLDLPRGTRARPGTFGRMSGRVAGSTRAGAGVVVPIGALIRRGQLDQLFVVEEGRARLRLIRAGREQEGFVQVLAGVRAGETVALGETAELGARLVDGQPVMVQP